MDIKNIVANTIAGTILALLFLFAFTWIIFDFQDSANSLKDTWSIVSSLFGGVATLAAAYIASLLFNDWKYQFRSELKSEYCREILNNLSALNQFVQNSYLLSQFIKSKTDFIEPIADKVSSIRKDMTIPVDKIKDQMNNIGNDIFTKEEVAEFSNYLGKIYDYQNHLTIATTKDAYDAYDDLPKKLKMSYENYELQSATVKSIATRYRFLNK